MSTNRREQERFSLNIQAKISYRHAKDQSTVIDTVAANISSGGAFLSTDHKFPLASKVAIKFYLQVADLQKLKFILSVESLKQIQGDHTWVSATGIVIRQTDDGVGVIFDTDYQITPI
ncbi:MAG: c-di-GMP-binding flagellar brake protein YcgR [Desulforhopalus sp.]|jgi:c-di-GMP-binding flagellar brake protein YcgR